MRDYKGKGFRKKREKKVLRELSLVRGQSHANMRRRVSEEEEKKIFNF